MHLARDCTGNKSNEGIVAARENDIYSNDEDDTIKQVKVQESSNRNSTSLKKKVVRF
jgi:hypothetical protein